MCNGNIENQKEALDGQVMDSINLILSNHFEVYHRENWPGYDELYIYTNGQNTICYGIMIVKIL